VKETRGGITSIAATIGRRVASKLGVDEPLAGVVEMDGFVVHSGAGNSVQLGVFRFVSLSQPPMFETLRQGGTRRSAQFLGQVKQPLVTNVAMLPYPEFVHIASADCLAPDTAAPPPMPL